jgi:hypothetical protein
LRTVPLSAVAVAALLEWQVRQGTEAEAAVEAWLRTGHVFTLADGRPLDPAYVKRYSSSSGAVLVRSSHR